MARFLVVSRAIPAVGTLFAGLMSLAQAPSVAAQCGPSQGTALGVALSRLAPEPTYGAAWSGQPVDSNYDSCADLSAIIVTIERATGSSPEQALMFHRGQYLGTGTSKATVSRRSTMQLPQMTPWYCATKTDHPQHAPPAPVP